ncbi:ankyrin repeat domain-containing protein [Polaribacter pectinis]|uniref:Ankyrin repeat domain-containing protein n=1 Tax=Polaribacter pectinis TaxID=2738844 RepID=A0A7G9L7T0_9FLAO|nr:ankyrin repeat domain-containing protein [Polaribacter pectinis]QNM84679.1 ankyrin repeat domain-containing protein [Polaribacter pectinis]
MKKLIVPMFACLFAFSTINATSLNNVVKTNSTEFTSFSSSVNTFCKLIQMGKYEAVASLIKAGENVNKKSNGLTPLMFAARHNKAKIAKLLIDNGAKLKTKSDKGNMTALSIAKRSKAVDAVKVIKEAL